MYDARENSGYMPEAETTHHISSHPGMLRSIVLVFLCAASGAAVQQCSVGFIGADSIMVRRCAGDTLIMHGLTGDHLHLDRRKSSYGPSSLTVAVPSCPFWCPLNLILSPSSPKSTLCSFCTIRAVLPQGSIKLQRKAVGVLLHPFAFLLPLKHS